MNQCRGEIAELDTPYGVLQKESCMRIHVGLLQARPDS